jgi:hypothetical protein
VLGALYAWYQFSKVMPTPEITPPPQAASSTEQSDLQASARALREAAAKLQADTGTSSATTANAQLQASQSALQKATAQQGSSGPSQAQLEASQQALEAAMQTKSQ